VQYDTDIIKNLGMNLQVVNAGSEQAILAALDAAYSREEPILFYFWTPHSIHAKYDLTEVKLPDYSDACYAKAKEGAVACDYPPDYAVRDRLDGPEGQGAGGLPAQEHKYTNDDRSHLAAVDTDKKSAEEAAQAWIDARAYGCLAAEVAGLRTGN
jgi:glycine betaine/proline transport system substrate-binding protein